MKIAAMHTLIAFAAGILVAVAAHASGKPWWVDWPMFGDATDIGVIVGLGTRAFLAMFEKEPA